jgi:hypothetical protein
MGLFDDINFNAEPSPNSSLDLRLLDTPCDHRIRDEQVNLDVISLLTNTPVSGNHVTYNIASYAGQIDPEASVTFTTNFPYVNDGSFSMSQSVVLNIATPITEEIIVTSPVSNLVSLKFPPKTNSVTAKQKIVLSNDEIVYQPFTRYNLYQLYGQIEFTNVADVGSTIIFSYYADKKRINAVNLDKTINYEFVGMNNKNQGVFRLYGRALLSTRPTLFVRYRTTQPNCPKCLGVGQLNDLNIDRSGRLQLVYDFSKLIQDYFKRLYTEKGSNPFDATDGTNLPTMVGIAKGDGLLMQSLVQAEVVNLLFAIRQKQRNQQGIQNISLAEQIAQINNIEVRSISPTDISVRIEVLSKSGKIEQIGSTVSLISGS